MGLVFWLYDRFLEPTLRFIAAKFGKKPEVAEANTKSLKAGYNYGAAPTSVVLWGPPGTGKTTLAYLIAATSGRRFVELSAVTAGVKDVRAVIEDARRRLATDGTETVLFIDEVHRFTKAQQDALLPGVENRWVTLVAATTENPYFSVISPLLSRSLLLTLQPLDTRTTSRRSCGARSRTSAASTARSRCPTTRRSTCCGWRAATRARR